MIFISGNVPSSKNSKRMITLKDGRKFLINSKTVVNYKKLADPQYVDKVGQFEQMIIGKPLPLKIEFTFIRDSKRLFDFVNVAQIILDMMQEFGWIEDDNYQNVVPFFNPVVVIDKQRAGVEIKVL